MSEEAGPSSPPSPALLPLPNLDVRWVHAGAQHLDLLPTPITSVGQSYKPFSEEESERIEERWLSLSEEERRRSVSEWGCAEGEGVPTKAKIAQKEKEKEKSKDRRRSISPKSDRNVRSGSLREGEVQDRLDGKLPKKEEVFSGQEQVKEEGEGRYKQIIRDIQKNYDLECVTGVPVSQVSFIDCFYRPS